MAVLALLLLSFGCSDDETGTHDPSAPVVVDQFYPKTGGVGTELIITGSNFSADPSQVSVKIGETPLVVLNSDLNNIVAIVPPKLGSGPFEVSIAGGAPVRTEESFSYIYSAMVSTLAGTGEAGFANGSGETAMFNFKSFDGNGWMKGAICADETGNVYVADIHNCLIRKITPDGTVSTLAGALGVNENLDGMGASAHVSNMVYGMDCDAEGNVWFVDTGSWLLRKATPDGVVTTVANCPFQPWYIRIDRKNGIAYMTVQDGSTGLYQYDMKSGEFSDLITGQAYAAVAVADDGTLYVSHSTDNTIERVVRTGDGWSRERLAGNGTAGYADGPFAEAQFSFPRGLVINSVGDVFVAGNGSWDVVGNADQSIRRLNMAERTVETIAGSGTPGYMDGVGNATAFSDPQDVAIDGTDVIYVFDRENNVIRKIIYE